MTGQPLPRRVRRTWLRAMRMPAARTAAVRLSSVHCGGAPSSAAIRSPVSSRARRPGGVERNPAEAGFVPQPKRWVVEQTYGTMSPHRRLVRDYEHDLASSESRVHRAMTDVMTRRLTGTSTPTWRSA
ncbi:hypothetical protein [Streptosporangium roseum]|uniref:hypothetical protein n=1 Tax=Streptosporangium roseum TaxID=2001 RepID=UPI001FE148D0|nr:hypothetical protein [Streptosporangium roseum]